MSVDWRALKKQKEDEVPSAELARQKRKDKWDKKVTKLTDTIERNIFNACKKQEAGTTVRYSLIEYGRGNHEIIMLLSAFFGNRHWSWDDKIKTQLKKNIITRLEADDITVVGVSNMYCVDITLP